MVAPSPKTRSRSAGRGAVPEASGLARAQRTLAAMAGTVFVLTLVAIAAIFVCRAAGVQQQSFASGPLALLAVFPLPGIAITLLLVIALIVVGAVHRTRAQRPRR